MPQVDVREVGDALNSALKMLETMISNIQRFLPKVRQNERMELSPCFFFLLSDVAKRIQQCVKIGLVIKFIG